MSEFVRSPQKIGLAIQIFGLKKKGLSHSQVGRRLGVSSALVSYYYRTYEKVMENTVVQRLAKEIEKLDDGHYPSSADEIKNLRDILQMSMEQIAATGNKEIKEEESEY